MFFEFQQEQIFKWLLNPNMYFVVAVLLLISWRRGVESLDSKFWVHTANDYFYGVMYVLFYFPIIAIILAGLKYATDNWFPWINLGLADHLHVGFQFLLVVLLDDFLSYWSHYVRHKIQPLWHFHTIHHSQERLNPLTTKRFHPIENLFDKTVIKWVPLAMVGSSLDVWILYYLLDAVWDYFIHSNIRINFGPFRYIVVTPQYHRIHHSRQKVHYDKNFSDRFVIWDVIFGTAYLKADEYPPTGIPEPRFPLENSISLPYIFKNHLAQLLYPFRMIAYDWKIRKKVKTEKI